MAGEEEPLARQELVERWQRLSDDDWEGRRQWYSDGRAFLAEREEHHGEHYWCHNGAVAGRFLDLMEEYHSQESLRRLWTDCSRHLVECDNGASCITEYHDALDQASAEARVVLTALDVRRVAAQLQGFTAHQQEPPPRATNGLFEALSYLPQLDDLEVVSELVPALLHAEKALRYNLAQGGRYDGLYFLLAHESPEIRATCIRAVKELGPFEDTEEAYILEPILTRWTRLLESDLFEAAPETNCDDRPRYRPQQLHVWGALELVLEQLAPGTCRELLATVPSLILIVFNKACTPDARTAGTVSGAAAENIQWRALSCLMHLLRLHRDQLWQTTSFDASVVVDDLIGQCFQVKGERFRKRIVLLLQHLLGSLETADATMLETQRRRILYFLLHQVSISASFTPLARGVATQTAFDILWQALGSGAPATEAAHIYGPSLVSNLMQPRQITHMDAHAKALKLAQATLRADAVVLASYNYSWRLEELDEVMDDEEVTVSVALDNRDSWKCCPALWHGVATHTNVSVMLMVMRAASVLAFSAPSPASTTARQGGGPAPPGGWCRDCLDLPSVLEGARSWGQPNGWMQSSKPVSVPASELAPQLLDEFRSVARKQMESLLSSGRLATPDAYTTSERVQLQTCFMLCAVGWHRPLRQVAKSAFLSLTGTNSMEEGLSVSLSDGGASSAVMGMINTILKRWQHGASGKPVMQMIATGNAEDLVHFLTAVSSMDGPASSSWHEDLRQRVAEFWQELLQTLSTELSSPGYSISAAAKPVLVLLLLAVRAEARSARDGPSAQPGEWFGALVSIGAAITRQAKGCGLGVATAWGDALVDVFECCQPTHFRQEDLQSLRALLGTDSALPDSIRVTLGPIAGSMPGSLGMKAMDNLPSRQQRPVVKQEDTGVIDLTGSMRLAAVPKDTEVGSLLDDDDDDDDEADSPIQASLALRRPPLFSRPAANEPPRDTSQLPRSGQAAALRKSTSQRYEDTPKLQQPVVNRSLSVPSRSQSQRPSNPPAPPRQPAAACAAVGGGPTSVAVNAVDSGIWPSMWPSAVQPRTEYGKGRELQQQKPVDRQQPVPPQHGQQQQQPARPLPRPAAPIPALPAPTPRLVATSDNDLFGSSSRSAVPPRQMPTIRRTTKPICDPVFGSRAMNAAPYAARRAHLQERHGPVLSMSAVQASILGWNFFEKVDRNRTKLWLPDKMVRFDGLEQYTRYYQQLLMEELRASLESGYEEETRVSSPLQSLSLRQYGGKVVQATDRVELRFEVRSDETQVVRGSLAPPGPRAHDLFLFTRKPFADTDALKVTRPRVHFLGMVVKTETLGGQLVMVVIANLDTELDVGASSTDRITSVNRHMQPRSSWAGWKVANLKPNIRELAALIELHSISPGLRSTLMDPFRASEGVNTIVSKLTLGDLSLKPGLRAQLEKDYNPSQLKAICHAASKRAQISLVQGPPGTGKTASIIAFISVLCANAQRERLASSDEGADQRLRCTYPTVAEHITWDQQAEVMEDDKEPPLRVLVCAQSNAAIDELLMRLAKRGLYDTNGRRRPAAAVRMGVVTPECKVSKFHIDEWASRRVRQRHEGSIDDKDKSSDKLKKDIEKTTASIAAAEATLEKDTEDQHAINRVNQLKAHRRQLVIKLDNLKRQAYQAEGRARQARQEEKLAVLRAAEVVVCTLSSAGAELQELSRTVANDSKSRGAPGHKGPALFGALIIDEAAQAVEPAALIPLRQLCHDGKIIFVGDTNQLPPTIISQAPGAAGLSQSLFARMQCAKYPVALLQYQYRMHPEISAFPSKHFYGGKLLNGIKAKPAAFHEAKCFAPYLFYNCVSGHTRFMASSMANEEEAVLVAALLKLLGREYGGEYGSVAVLTPYRAQKRAIERRLVSELGQERASGIPVATVDSYQGQEADVVIFSCVRADRSANPQSGVGFLSDVRRLNVGITRAKLGLWIVGHAPTLKRNPTWNSLIEDATNRNALVEAQRPFNAMLEGMCTSRGNSSDCRGLQRSRSGHGADSIHESADIRQAKRARVDAPETIREQPSSSGRTWTEERGSGASGLALSGSSGRPTDRQLARENGRRKAKGANEPSGSQPGGQRRQMWTEDRPEGQRGIARGPSGRQSSISHRISQRPPGGGAVAQPLTKTLAAATRAPQAPTGADHPNGSSGGGGGLQPRTVGEMKRRVIKRPTGSSRALPDGVTVQQQRPSGSTAAVRTTVTERGGESLDWQLAQRALASRQIVSRQASGSCPDDTAALGRGRTNVRHQSNGHGLTDGKKLSGWRDRFN